MQLSIALELGAEAFQTAAEIGQLFGLLVALGCGAGLGFRDGIQLRLCGGTFRVIRRFGGSAWRFSPKGARWTRQK